MGIGKLFAGFGSDKKYQTMGPDELLKLDNVELRDAISARLMKEAGRHHKQNVGYNNSGPDTTRMM